jgi:hypothetical protein
MANSNQGTDGDDDTVSQNVQKAVSAGIESLVDNVKSGATAIKKVTSDIAKSFKDNFTF